MSIFKRNFTAYFLNPTGYVFICVFVLLSSIAAFLPDEFVNMNLANLTQLNRWFPLIMLFFIPAITMGIWSDERRFGTEELLLTMPVSPFRIILGKYLAALGVYSISLLFSMATNFLILRFLGKPDVGLFMTTCLGYWLLGGTMLALGMLASFLTSQLTVAYILGGLLNAPLIALQWSDAAPISHQTASFLKSFGLVARFEPFGQGMISLASLLYFILVPVMTICFCLLLLNRRYWPAGKIRRMTVHSLVRVPAIVILTVSLIGLLDSYDLKFDATEEKLSTLSRESLLLIEKQKTQYPIVIEAWLSPELPQEFARTKLDIISVLGAIKSHSPNPVFLDIRETLPSTKEAYRLERLYDIKPKKVFFDVRGRAREEAIFLTVIFRCGPKTVTIPFLNRGLSVEYELINALLGVDQREKKHIGIVRTAAGLLGRFDASGNPISGTWLIVDELEKQYIVHNVDPEEPIPAGKYDVLLTVQPSSLTQKGMINFANAVRHGQPSVIFEDPYPIFADYIPGTKIPTGPGMPIIPPELRGDLGILWAMLGVTFSSDVLWKNYNPYPKLAALSEEYVFIDAAPIKYNNNSSGKDPVKRSSFDTKDPITARLEHLLYPFCGFFNQAPHTETAFTPLIQTLAGGFTDPALIQRRGIRTYSAKRINREEIYTVAARVTGKVPKAFLPPGSENLEPAFNVVVASDLDLLTPGFFKIREMGTDVRNGVTLDFDNVNFVLNAIDSCAGSNELIPIRTRRPRHRTLSRIEETTQKIRDKAMTKQIALARELEEYRRQEEGSLQKKIQDMLNRRTDKKASQLTREESMEIQTAAVAAQQRLNRQMEEKQRRNDKEIEETQREVDEYVRQIQGRYKLYAVLFPPIPPLIIGIVVFLRRRRQIMTFRR